MPGGVITRSKSLQQTQVQPEPQVLVTALEEVIVPSSAAEEVVPATQLEVGISVNDVEPAGAGTSGSAG